MFELLIDSSSIFQRPSDPYSDETLTLSELCPPLVEPVIRQRTSSASTSSVASSFLSPGRFGLGASPTPLSPALPSQPPDAERPRRTFAFRQRRLDVEVYYLRDNAFRAFFRVSKKVFEDLLCEFGQHFPQGRQIT